MLLLLLALVATFLGISLGMSGLRGNASVGALFWYTCFFTAFIHLAFLGNFVATGMNESGPSGQGLVVTTLSLIATVVSGRAFSAQPVPPERLNRESLSADTRRLWAMAVVVLLPAWAYFALLGTVPLISALQAVLSGGSSGLGVLQEARLARDPYVNSNAQYIPFQGLLELFRNVGAPIVFAAALHYFALERRKRYVLLMGLCFITVLGAGQRWPLQYLLLCALFSLLLGTRNRSGQIWKIAGIGVLLGALLTLMQGRASSPDDSGGGGIIGGLKAIGERLLFGYAELPIKSYTLDLDILRDQGGSTYWQTIQTFLPGQSESYAVTFYNIVQGIDGGYTASPDFGTELYINFGLIGVVAGSALWGVCLSLADAWVLPRVNSIEGLALASGMLLCFAAAATEGAAGSVMRYLVLAPLVVVGTSVVGRFFGASPTERRRSVGDVGAGRNASSHELNVRNVSNS